MRWKLFDTLSKWKLFTWKSVWQATKDFLWRQLTLKDNAISACVRRVWRIVTWPIKKVGGWLATTSWWLTLRDWEYDPPPVKPSRWLGIAVTLVLVLGTTALWANTSIRADERREVLNSVANTLSKAKKIVADARVSKNAALARARAAEAERNAMAQKLRAAQAAAQAQAATQAKQPVRSARVPRSRKATTASDPLTEFFGLVW